MSGDLSVGVVIPTRNAAAYVLRAIDSVLAQDPAPHELVVVDGGSTDGTPDLVHGLSPASVRLVHQRGAGLAGARNDGIAVLTTDLVAFCDADDRWLPGALSRRVEHLRENPHCAAVIGAVMTEALDGLEVPERQRSRLGRVVPGYTPGALLARRAVFDLVGPFRASMQVGGDSEWFVRLIQSSCRIDTIDDVVLAKGVRPDSLSVDVGTYRRELLAVAREFIDRARLGRDRDP